MKVRGWRWNRKGQIPKSFVDNLRGKFGFICCSMEIGHGHALLNLQETLHQPLKLEHDLAHLIARKRRANRKCGFGIAGFGWGS